MQAKARFNEIAEELTQLATTFSNNLLDGTKAFSKLLSTQEEVAGLPPSALALLAQQAKGKGHDGATAEAGPWLVTLDMPAYLPIQTHCENRAVREEVYRAFITRASAGEQDNTGPIGSILKLRKEKAALLGYAHHADVSLAPKVRCTATSSHTRVAGVPAMPKRARLPRFRNFLSPEGPPHACATP